jgi:hypothetical protein
MTTICDLTRYFIIGVMMAGFGRTPSTIALEHARPQRRQCT